MQRPDPSAITVERRDGFAFRRFGEIFDRGERCSARIA
jgi:hypothetical protein